MAANAAFDVEVNDAVRVSSEPQCPDLGERSHSNQQNSSQRTISSNGGQEFILNHIMTKFVGANTSVDRENEPRLMLVTGKPGTGKSHFIKMVKDAIRASDIQGRVICTSYNGIAAVNVGGTTASALFQLGKDNVDVAKLRSELHIEDRLALLVIDKISMLSS